MASDQGDHDEVPIWYSLFIQSSVGVATVSNSFETYNSIDLRNYRSKNQEVLFWIIVSPRAGREGVYSPKFVDI